MMGAYAELVGQKCGGVGGLGAPAGGQPGQYRMTSCKKPTK